MFAPLALPKPVAAAVCAATLLIAGVATAQAAEQPQVAVDPAGTAHLMWLRHDGGKLVVQGRSRADDGTLTPTDFVSGAGYHTAWPAIASGAAGSSLSVWNSVEPGGHRLMLRRRSADGSLGPVQTISDAGVTIGADVAVAPTGAAVIAWRREVDGKHVVEARRRAANGTLGPIRRLSASSPAHSVLSLDLAIDPAGAAVVAWHVNAPTTYVQARRLHADGTLGPVKNVTSGSSAAAAPAVGAAPDGSALIAFRRRRESQHLVQVRRYGADGTLGTTRDVSGLFSTQPQPRVAFAPNGAAVVAWKTAENGGSVQAVPRSPGGTLGAVADVSPAEKYTVDFTAGIDADGDAVLAWRVWDGGTAIYAQLRRLSATGALSPVHDFSPLDGTAGPVALGVEPGGGALLAWEDGAAHQIVGRRRTAAGEIGQIHTLSN